MSKKPETSFPQKYPIVIQRSDFFSLYFFNVDARWKRKRFSSSKKIEYFERLE
jgi:hypothetical protein